MTAALDAWSGQLVAPAAVSDLPAPAGIAPPPVAVTGQVGSQPTLYARMDHTHSSSVQVDNISVPAGASPVTVNWTFPNANLYTNPPKVLGQGVLAGTATQPIVVNVVAGSITATGCQFRVYQASAVTVSILGAVVNAFGGTIPAGTTINCYAHP